VPEHPRIQRIAADVTDTQRLIELTTGAGILFNCAAPPYHKWRTELLPLARSLVATAEATGAGYVMLGNLYGYGPVDAPMTEEMTEDLPMAPHGEGSHPRAGVAGSDRRAPSRTCARHRGPRE
jgi:hypothetical protein